MRWTREERYRRGEHEGEDESVHDPTGMHSWLPPRGRIDGDAILEKLGKPCQSSGPSDAASVGGLGGSGGLRTGSRDVGGQSFRGLPKIPPLTML